MTPPALSLPIAGTRVRLAGSPRELTIHRLAEDLPVGRIRLSIDGGALVVDELCVDAPARGYGLGSEAARLLRQAAAAGGWSLLRAWAPPDRGLALYFWCRMGLRPCFGPGPRGGLWLERCLAGD